LCCLDTKDRGVKENEENKEFRVCEWQFGVKEQQKVEMEFELMEWEIFD
jgi:hypothetical protein